MKYIFLLFLILKDSQQRIDINIIYYIVNYDCSLQPFRTASAVIKNCLTFVSFLCIMINVQMSNLDGYYVSILVLAPGKPLEQIYKPQDSTNISLRGKYTTLRLINYCSFIVVELNKKLTFKR